MAGKLTTHVLDTARGTAADGLVVSFRRLAPEPTPPLSVTLDEGGRGTLLAADAMLAGQYEIVFFAADYHRKTGAPLTEPPFLDAVPIRFGISDPASHYHVPLVLSPYGYSTYRGG